MDETAPRVVVTFTTLPDRYNVLQKSLVSISQQTHRVDAIYLTVPRICKRLNKPYPVLPKEITDNCIIVECDVDYGPITKIYGALVSEADPETIIISCDDDTIYDPKFVETIVKYGKKHPDIAISGTGALISKGIYLLGIKTTLQKFLWVNPIVGFNIDEQNGRNVDLIFGVGGVLYRRKFFPTKENLDDDLFNISLSNDELFHNDDIVISGYLSKHGIERKVFHDIPPVITDSSGDDALSKNFLFMLNRLQLAIASAKAQGLYSKMEPLSVDETVPGKVFFLLLLLIFAIVAVIMAYIMF